MNNYVLVYARNIEQRICFPCKDMDHARQLARLIMDSDSLNGCVGVSYFDLYEYDVKMAQFGDKCRLEL